MDRKEKLGIAVKTERLRRNMTQTELGEKLGVSKQVVSDMEHERRAISRKMAKELSKIFDVSVERFI